ncbi:MAG: SIMPL domain-containing protein [Lutisporaceae bacterium]
MMIFNNVCPYITEEFSKCKKRTIKVNGRGTVDASPDIAIISAGVITEDKNAQNAQNQNDLIINNIISALIRIGIKREDIKTQSYTIYPNYDFVEGKQILNGYRATHILEIKVNDLDKVGLVLNTVMENGANQINQIEFTIKDSAKYYNRALKLAIADAAGKAETISEAMKVMLDMVPCSIIELSTSFSPLTEQGVMKLAALDVVMPGKIKVTATIEAEYVYY